MRYPARSLFALLIGLLVSASGAPLGARRQAAAPPVRDAAASTVLMLHSYDVSSDWTLNMARGLAQELEAAGYRLDVRSEFLDFRHDSRPEYRQALHTMLRVKYGAVAPRLIVTTDDGALEFLLEHPDLMGRTPVVFGGVNNDALAARVPRSQVTGVREVFRLDRIVEVALRLRPDTRRVLLVTDDTLLGESVRVTFRKVMAPHAAVAFVGLSTAELTWEQLLARLSTDTSATDLVVATPVGRDRTGRHFTGRATLRTIGSASHAPVVAIGLHQDSAGMLAGTLDTGRQHGVRMGELAVQLLNGRPASSIPIEHDDTTLLAFDAQQLARWRIDEGALPADVVVYNRTPSFYRANKAAIWLGVAFMLAQSLIIAGLVVNVRRRWRAELGLASQAHALAAANTELEDVNRSLVREQEVRLRAEEHLRHAQKMEAVGRLAGGVAHDFNNLLTVIIGYCALLLEHAPRHGVAHEGLEQIRRASEQAATLTQNLLAFSRRQLVNPAVIQVGPTIAAIEPMLRRFCGERVVLSLDLDREAGHVELPEGQLEQVLINLVINARDAMPGGGHLRIAAHHERVTSAPALAPDLPAGDYAVVTVTDTGQGMDAATRDHVFEPFFTTKGVGRGTGLGLSTVYGTVTQHRGRVAVESEPGRGSTFVVWLPTTSRRPDGALALPCGDPAAPGHVVLVVEDEAQVRQLACLVLRQAGYRVLEADGGPAALRVAGRHSGPIDLVLTDIVMPGDDGFTVAQQLRRARPDLAVAYMSGYTEPSEDGGPPLADVTPLLRKPFMPEDLLSHVRQALRMPVR